MTRRYRRTLACAAAAASFVALTALPAQPQSQQGAGGSQSQQGRQSQQGQGQQRGPVRAQEQQMAAPTALEARILEDRVQMRLANSPSLSGTDITVAIEGRTAVLSGSVPSENAKNRALHIATWTPGITDVKDQLRVDKSQAQRSQPTVGDEQLAQQVAQKLASDVFKNAKTEEDWLFGWEVKGSNFEFDVEVDDGQVTLQGEVPSPDLIPQAVSVARKVPGVRSVFSQLYPRGGYGPYGYRGPYGPYGYGPYAYPYGYPG